MVAVLAGRFPFTLQATRVFIQPVHTGEPESIAPLLCSGNRCDRVFAKTGQVAEVPKARGDPISRSELRIEFLFAVGQRNRTLTVRDGLAKP